MRLLPGKMELNGDHAGNSIDAAGGIQQLPDLCRDLVNGKQLL